MTKKVAVFNDISGFGRCSLTAAIPVLSALGVQCNPIPTVILSGQGGYTTKYREEMTHILPEFTRAWKANRASFDGIYTGYLANGQQIKYILDFLQEFRKDNTFLLADPVMGDHGKGYCTYSADFLAAMKALVPHANLITPNLTEACMLTNHNFDEICATPNPDALLEQVISIGNELRSTATVSQDVVITGVKVLVEGEWKIYNVAVTEQGNASYSSKWFDKSFSGTGDLFTSAMCGLRMNGYTTVEALKIAGNFIYYSILDTMQESCEGNEGIQFEHNLIELIKL